MATGVSGPVQVMLANTIPAEGPAVSGMVQQVGCAGHVEKVYGGWGGISDMPSSSWNV